MYEKKCFRMDVNKYIMIFYIYCFFQMNLCITDDEILASAAVVMQLSEKITEPNHLLCLDNYFSNYPLFQFLYDKKIYPIGTIRVNRFYKSRLLPIKEMKKKGRGSVDINVSSDGQVILTQWFDNKLVTVGSNFIADGQFDYYQRWNRQTKRYINVPRPECIKLYNRNMGGVDQLDCSMSLYRCFTCWKKWTICMIFHTINMAVTNSWGEYGMQAAPIGLCNNTILDLLHFRQEVAQSLILFKNESKP